MAKFLRIAQWNANGLAQHKGEVQLFLQQNKIDILLVSENHSIMKTHFQIPQYNTYYTNQPFKMSSTKRSIKHRAKLQSHSNPLLTYLLTYLLHGVSK